MRLPWLRHTWEQLMISSAQNRLGHALGLYHKPALGSDKLLDMLINWLLCQSVDKKQQPCKQCKACQLYTAGTHPDFRRLQPEPGRTLGVDEVRLLQSRLAQSSHQGGVKVAVIEQAEKMTINAANALLKTLEEPPGDTYLILTVSRFDDVLPTIRSRLQVYSLVAPGEAELAGWLSRYSDTTVSPSAALQAWRERPLDALQRLKQALIEHDSIAPAEVLDISKDAEQWILHGSAENIKDAEQAIDLINQSEYWLISRFPESSNEKVYLNILHELRRVRYELRSRSGLNVALSMQYIHSQLQPLIENSREL